MFIINTSVKETIEITSSPQPFAMDNEFYGARLIGAGLGHKKEALGERNERQNRIIRWLRKNILATRSDASVPLVGLNSNPYA